MNRYPIDRIYFEGLETHKRRDFGDVLVGGDRGDVAVSLASQAEGGVECSGVVLRSSLDLTREQAEEEAREIVLAAYGSIGGEAFAGKVRY